MDGVIADFEFLKPLDFQNKRPIQTNIKTLESISRLKDIKVYILLICKKDEQINDKNIWLDKYDPFFQKENRIIISKESRQNKSSKELKERALKKQIKALKRAKVVLIDDDNAILKHLAKNVKNIILFQDSSLID